MVKRNWLFKYILPVIAVFALFIIVFPLPSFAACSTTLTLTITSCPNAPIDSNKAADGPLVTTVTALITNTGTGTASNTYVHIGDGTTPGTFPTGTDGNSLSLLGGIADATRYLVDLAPGQSKTIYWMMTYPYGSKFVSSQTYPYTVWADNTDGCYASTTNNITTLSATSASSSKRGTITLNPPDGIVNPGNILSVTETGFNFGTIGADDDIFLQPNANLLFNPTCFKLFKTEVYIETLNGTGPGLWPMPVTDQLYFPDAGLHYNKNHSDTDYVTYYFVALGSCNTTLKPYQIVASGQLEKYPPLTGIAILTSNSGGLGFSKSVNPTSANAGDILTWTITYTNNTLYPIGDPDTGNGLVVLDEAIPTNTTYIAGSANCTGYPCIKLFSTDNGATWTSTEPAPASITKIKWYINAQIPSGGSGTVYFQTRVNNGTPSCTQICNTARASIDDGAELISSIACTSGNQILVPLTGTTTFCYGDNTTITANASGGTGPYSYSWTGTGTPNNNTFVATASGTVSVHVTDTATGCTSDNSTNVTELPLPIATASSNSPICIGNTIQLTGGPAGMNSYSWTGPNGFFSNQQSPSRPNATGDMSGTYTLVVTNDNGCTSDNATVSVRVILCGGGGDGQVGFGQTAPQVAICPLTLTVNMLGEITTAKMTSDGVLCEDCLAYDPGKQNSWEAKAGTKLTLVNKQVPRLIKVTLAGSSPPSGAAETIGQIYAINAYPSLSATNPLAINISPLFTMASAYDPNQLPTGTSEVTLSYYPNPNQGWLAMDSQGVVAELGKAQGTLDYFVPDTLLAKLGEAAANFSVSNLNISPIKIQPTQQVTISVNVTNDGVTSGEYTVELKVNGAINDSKSVSLAAGEIQTVSFTIAEDAIGKYQIEIAGLTGELVVVESSGLNWWIIGGIIAAILLVLGIWILLRWRRSSGY